MPQNTNRYRAENGSVIDSETGTVWKSGWKQSEAEAIAKAFNTKDFSQMIFRNGAYIIGVKGVTNAKNDRQI